MSRDRLGDIRDGITHSAVIGTEKIYIRTGEYPDGSLGEVFIDIDKAGGQLRVYDVLATIISVGLQSGIPVQTIVDKLKFQRMEPQGMTSNQEIPIALSISDYVGRWLEKKYI